MAKKTVSVGDIDEIPASELRKGCDEPRFLQTTAHALDHVGHWVEDDDPACEELWIEVRQTIKEAKMSPLQRYAFVWHLRGLSIRSIATVKGRSHTTIEDALNGAKHKFRGVESGYLTNMIDTLGWAAVREHLADQRYAKMPRLPSHLKPKNGHLVNTKN